MIGPRARALAAAWRVAAGGACVAGLLGCASPGPAPAPGAGPALETSTVGGDDRLIVVAVVDAPDPLPSAGATPRADYRHATGYGGGARAAALAAAVARDHRLQQQSVWTIDPLHLRCMLYRIAPDADRAAVLAALADDARVRLAQPLNRFDTLGSPYNDPYVDLQRGFVTIDAAGAQRWSRGEGVRVALIDSGVDAAHPDLAGQIASQRDFVTAGRPAPGGELHGTEMAGVIAARANNAIGIVGVAPRVRLLAYRACWAVDATGGGSRCDSFTLAQALGAAIAADADVINLSLGGPADPLLERLARYAIDRGTIVVGALPASGRREGFPAGVAGVLAVGSADGAAAQPQALAAPGRDILTLTPGGHYDYASGSSLAAAHVTGAVALLRALDPGLRAPMAQDWLERSSKRSGDGSMDACAALRQLRPAAECGAGAEVSR